MLLDEESEKKIFRKAALSRAFEEEAFEKIQEKIIKIPAYLSAGQEYTAASLSVFLEKIGCDDKQIFMQHRGHSTYLSFGGDIEKLILELLGKSSGCANGKGGSASIQSREKNIYGHDGLMGSQGPIATGACYANKKFTLCFAGDAAAEEDYFLASIGWASTKKMPIWFIIEDNNLSILTEKKVRRNWELHDVARAFQMKAFSVTDNPYDIWNCIESNDITGPCLLNINTNRLFWHAGAGIDNVDQFDRQKLFIEKFGMDIILESKNYVKEIWQKCLSH